MVAHSAPGLHHEYDRYLVTERDHGCKLDYWNGLMLAMAGGTPGHSARSDVSVVCGPAALADDDQNGITNPSVIVEVLSPGTEDYDRTDKAGRSSVSAFGARGDVREP